MTDCGVTRRTTSSRCPARSSREIFKVPEVVSLRRVQAAHRSSRQADPFGELTRAVETRTLAFLILQTQSGISKARPSRAAARAVGPSPGTPMSSSTASTWISSSRPRTRDFAPDDDPCPADVDRKGAFAGRPLEGDAVHGELKGMCETDSLDPAREARKGANGILRQPAHAVRIQDRPDDKAQGPRAASTSATVRAAENKSGLSDDCVHMKPLTSC